MKLILISVGVLALLMMAVPLWWAVVFAAEFMVPWLMIGLLIWSLYMLGRGPRRRRWDRMTWQSRPMPPPRRVYPVPVTPPPSPPPPRPQPPARPELPIDVQVKVEQIRRKVEVLLGYATRFPPFSKDLFLVKQTASEYLPRTVDAFLALPIEDGDRVLIATGKTALQELKDQLDLLDAKLDDIAEDLQRQDVDRLLANRRFLEARFGQVKV
ncbi:MAG: hypothetical protein ACRDIY_09735 [Chloroflexota bacterium]